MNVRKKIAAVFIVVLISTTVTVSVSAAKPERPDPLDAVWDATTYLQTQASWLWGNITQLQNTDTTLQEQIDTKQSSEPDYDSGWIDIRGMTGADILINHTLNTTDPRVYITGKTTADGGVHQRYLGLVNTGTYELKTFDGSNNTDRGYSLVQTSDGGYALLGDTYSSTTGLDVWLMKTDADGNLEWSQTFDGSNDVDRGNSLVQTSDGGYVILGETSNTTTGLDVWLIKTDADGNHLWNQTFGGSNNDAGYSLVQTSDGGYAITGSTEYAEKDVDDVLLIKTDADGNKLWNQTFGGSSYETGYSLVQTSDGGYYITGSTGSYGAGASDVWLIKTDADGNKLWDKTFGGSGYDSGSSLVQTSDSGYAITGYTGAYEAGTGDVLLIKFDPNGESGLAWIDSTENSVTLHRGFVDTYWNYVRVQIWTLD